MKIRTRLFLSAAASIALAVALGLVVLFMNRQVNEGATKAQVGERITVRLSELNSVTSDYMVYGGERARTQWYSIHESLVALVSTDEFVAGLQRDVDRIDATFAQLVAVRESQTADGADIAAASALEDRLMAQLSLLTQSMTSDAAQLADAGHREQSGAQRRATILILAFGGALLAVVAGTSLFIAASIANPIARLTRVAERIAQGDLDARVQATGKDELGVLGRTFDTMTERLKETVASLEERIAERKRAEEALARRAEELVRSNAELEQFAYIASHDLQEPLRMVTSYTQLLAQRYEGKLDSDADDFIAYAVGGAKRMQGLIQDLLAYSRVVRTGREFEPADCETVLQHALTDMEVLIEESGAVVTYDPLPTLTADQVQLGQVFRNLIANAIKFRGEDPPRVHVSAEQQGDDWVFSLRDNGIGIDPEYAERIFVIFQRLHGKEEYPGTGMGLTICKKIVEGHGGRIWVESEAGAGATFHFRLPAVAETRLAA